MPIENIRALLIKRPKWGRHPNGSYFPPIRKTGHLPHPNACLLRLLAGPVRGLAILRCL
jgi:hypothetical protein